MATRPVPHKTKTDKNEAIERLVDQLSDALDRRLAGKSRAERAKVTRKLRALANRSRAASERR